MKMVKSLLLGSAAGLVAVTAGQAADLPVKAKPVEYVRICSLYGAGFYYMPGTDLCIKVGGWVRAEATYGGNGNMVWGPFNNNANNRNTSNTFFRARGYITADVRSQTAYGTARGYLAVGVSTNDAGLQAPALSDSINRAFVQWAGMTAGLSQSFYDFYSVPVVQYRGGYLPASDTGDPGWWVWGYTAQFGGGFSGTVSMEARRVMQIIDQNAITAGSGGTIVGGYACAVTSSATAQLSGGCQGVFPGAGAYGGQQMGDVVANLRVDQAWGGAQVMGALHEVNASYYSASNVIVTPPNIAAGHPDDKWGWAAGAGIRINTPMIGQGDFFQTQVNYTEGALRYLFFSENSNWNKVDGASEAYGVLTDCVYGGVPAVGNQTGCHLTTAWGINASYEHYWNPQWHTSLYGAYYGVSYDKGTGSANAMLCEAAGFGNGLGGAASAGIPGCNNDWSTWGIGSRTQWDVTKTFYLGVEVLYENLHSATTGCAVITPGGCGGVANAGPTLVVGGSGAIFQEANSGNWSATLRAHRDFLP